MGARGIPPLNSQLGRLTVTTFPPESRFPGCPGRRGVAESRFSGCPGRRGMAESRFSGCPPAGLRCGWAELPAGLRGGWAELPAGLRWGWAELPAGLRWGWAELPAGLRGGWAELPAGPESRFSVGPGGRGWRSAGSLGGPGGGGWRSAGSLLALAGEGSGIRGGPSEFRGRPIARLNRIGNLRASVEEFLEFARRGSANGTPLEVDSGGRFSSASGGPRGPPWNFSGRCAGHGGEESPSSPWIPGPAGGKSPCELVLVN